MLIFGIPELLLIAVPILAGILAGRYVGRIANFCTMLVLFQFDMALLDFLGGRVFRPRFLIPIIFVYPAISAMQCLPPLVFLLVALIVYRYRNASATGVRS